MKLLVLDFDGVISNSARECFEVALRTYRRLGRLGAGAARLEKRSPEALYQAFVELMPLGNRAEDFAIALVALENRVALSDQADYDRYRARLDEERLESFHAAFYRERETLAAEDPARWNALLEPYPEFVDLLKRRAGSCPYAIATAKDRPTVLTLLARYGLRDLFPDALIRDKESGVSKRAHHRALAEATGIAPSEMVFIDDKVNHLQSVAELGVRGVLAAWGFNGERERRLARDRGFSVCGLDRIESELFADQ